MATSIPKARSSLYRLAKFLGDVQAVERSIQTGSPKPIERRIVRRTVGRAVGKGMRRAGL